MPCFTFDRTIPTEGKIAFLFLISMWANFCMPAVMSNVVPSSGLTWQYSDRIT